MFEIMPETNERVLAIKNSGLVTSADYEATMPELQQRFEALGGLRAYLDWQDLEGWDPAGESDAFMFRNYARGKFERIAIVGPEKWADEARQMAEHMNAKIRLFRPDQQDEAWAWVNEA